MQDNAPIYTTQLSKDQLIDYGVATIDFSKYLPDLNPIKYLQQVLKKKLYKLYPKFNTIGTLEEDWDRFEAGLVEVWAAIPDLLIRRLIYSIPRRLDAVAVARGYQTKYQAQCDRIATLIFNFRRDLVELYRFKIHVNSGDGGPSSLREQTFVA